MGLFQGHKDIDAPKNIITWDVDPYSEKILMLRRRDKACLKPMRK
tara:strand:+ start:376 stop:510 length:135 start_codon:yes stop_codon:yes gene_type:complete